MQEMEIAMNKSKKRRSIANFSPSIPYLPMTKEGDEEVVDVKSIAKDLTKSIISQKGSKFKNKLLKDSAFGDSIETPGLGPADGLRKSVK